MIRILAFLECNKHTYENEHTLMHRCWDVMVQWGKWR